ncbi:MAG TPA: alpha/beta fold hydrolase [Gemmatimonadaceae bacterium]|nr:alpha/beta fold hydrolase [Gemmatimonadaceae bacterium]
MRWRKAAAAGGAALGAAALYNVTASHRIADLENDLGGESCELLWRGHRVAYTRHGNGEPVLLVHGIYAGASSNEWRHTVDALAERYTVFAVDLIGFGRSDRPRLRYTPAFYQALLGDLMGRLGRGPLAVVASSLSAAHVVSLAARDPRHVTALALIEPTGLGQLSGPPTTAQSAAQLLLDAPIVGTSAYNALTSPASVRRFLEEIYVDHRLVTDELVESYVRNARQPGGKFAVSSFVGGQLNVDIRQSLRRVRQPMLILWGEQARQNPVQHAHGFRVLKPEADWALIASAGDLPHDEQPRAANAVLHGFLARVKSGTRGPRTSRNSA